MSWFKDNDDWLSGLVVGIALGAVLMALLVLALI